MKKKWWSILVILVIGFWLGGAVVAYNTGTPLIEGIIGSEATKSVQADDNQPVAGLSNLGVADIVEQSGPAVVTVEVEIPVTSMNSYFDDPFFEEFFGPFSESPQQPLEQRYRTGSGTGFLISEDGYILTNQHVIENAEKIYVILNDSSEKVEAEVAGQDYELDLAILQVEGRGYPYLPLGDSSQMRVGDFVVAIGSPYSLDHTTTFGVISATGRPITVENRSYPDLIQTDAAINPGNSGGPLLNMQGEVIAINTAVNAVAQGIGFAIPVNNAKNVLSELIETGSVTRPYIGVSMNDLSNLSERYFEQLELSPDDRGALVVGVIQNSPAEAAGIQAGDLITKVNGTAVDSSLAVREAIAACAIGDRASIEIKRAGQIMSLMVFIEVRPY